MASNIDMSLDDLVTLNKKKGGNKGGGKPFQGKPKPGGGKPKPIGGKPQTSSQQTKNIDLRKVISSKQKAGITDLRTKLKPKALYTSKFANKQMSKSNPTTPKATGKPWPAKSPRFKYETEEIPHSRKSDPGPLLSGRRPNSPKLPTYEEAKKITVTVPGSLQPTTSTEVSDKSPPLSSALSVVYLISSCRLLGGGEQAVAIGQSSPCSYIV